MRTEGWAGRWGQLAALTALAVACGSDPSGGTNEGGGGAGNGGGTDARAGSAGSSAGTDNVGGSSSSAGSTGAGTSGASAGLGGGNGGSAGATAGNAGSDTGGVSGSAATSSGGTQGGEPDPGSAGEGGDTSVGGDGAVGGSSSNGGAGAPGEGGDGGNAGSGPDPSSCIVYVDQATGSDNKAGQAWNAAKATLQAGIDAAAALAPCDVWAAQGKYVPTYKADPFSAARFATLNLRAGVRVYGGFAKGEATLEDRNFDAHETIVTGEIGTADKTDNLYNVVTATVSTTLDGLIIEGGYMPAGPYNTGAGIRCSAGNLSLVNVTLRDNDAFRGAGLGMIEACNVSIRDSAFYRNEALSGYQRSGQGGGIYNDSGKLEIVSSNFLLNTATTYQDGPGQGGGIYSGGSIVLTDTSFSDNEATDGAGLYTTTADVKILDSLFTANHGINHGGAVYGVKLVRIEDSLFWENVSGTGGALYLVGGGAVLRSEFEDNQVINYGGAIYGVTLEIRDSTFTDNKALPALGSFGDGGAVMGSGLVIRGCAFTGNQGDRGGALSSYGTAQIVDSHFSDNVALLAGGGAVYTGCSVVKCELHVVGSSFERNEAQKHSNLAAAGFGGAIAFKPGECDSRLIVTGSLLAANVAHGSGGGIAFTNGSACTPFSISNSTLFGNSAAATGGGMYASGASSTLLNDIFWGNTSVGEGPQAFNTGNAQSTIRYSNIQGAALSGNGNIDANPLFVSTTAGALDLKLQAGSPCANTGSNADLPADLLDLDGDANVAEALPLDVAGAARVNGAAVDMGAYER